MIDDEFCQLSAWEEIGAVLAMIVILVIVPAAAAALGLLLWRFLS